ncbi:TPA: recombinase family protein [Staphylococcus aureus]
MAKVGYARVSTKDQSLDSQIDILKMNGCEKIFSEKVSGRKGKRTELEITSMNIKTDDAMGKMFFTMMSAFAELEANLMSERTRKGLASARARGKKGGRPRISSEKLKKIKYLNDEKQIPPSEIAELVGVSRSTVFRYIKD